jgi:hypothetical protein
MTQCREIVIEELSRQEVICTKKSKWSANPHSCRRCKLKCCNNYGKELKSQRFANLKVGIRWLCLNCTSSLAATDGGRSSSTGSGPFLKNLPLSNPCKTHILNTRTNGSRGEKRFERHHVLTWMRLRLRRGNSDTMWCPDSPCSSRWRSRAMRVMTSIRAWRPRSLGGSPRLSLSAAGAGSSLREAARGWLAICTHSLTSLTLCLSVSPSHSPVAPAAAVAPSLASVRRRAICLTRWRSVVSGEGSRSKDWSASARRCSSSRHICRRDEGAAGEGACGRGGGAVGEERRKDEGSRVETGWRRAMSRSSASRLRRSTSRSMEERTSSACRATQRLRRRDSRLRLRAADDSASSEAWPGAPPPARAEHEEERHPPRWSQTRSSRSRRKSAAAPMRWRYSPRATPACKNGANEIAAPNPNTDPKKKSRETNNQRANESNARDMRRGLLGRGWEAFADDEGEGQEGIGEKGSSRRRKEKKRRRFFSLLFLGVAIFGFGAERRRGREGPKKTIATDSSAHCSTYICCIYHPWLLYLCMYSCEF